MSTLAVELTNKCYETKDTYLDLGRCGLRDEDFAEGSSLDIALQKCTHLEKLILSNEWVEFNEETKRWKNHRSVNQSGTNYFTTHPPALLKLHTLVMLKCGGTYQEKWSISDISFLQHLIGLQSLDLRDNQISDLSSLQHLNGLQSLYLTNNQISDLSSLQHLIGLQSLYLTNNQISDLSSLQHLIGLQSLYLRDNQISDLSSLQHLNGLQSLYLTNNQISDLSSLQHLIGLQSLYLTNNQISDLSSLQHLIGLQSLYLTNNQISDLSSLQHLIGLQSLYLTNNQISDLSSLQHLIGLQSLYLTNNQISDLSSLQHLIGLQSLYLRSNQISDLSSLQHLNGLKYLDLRYNQISDIDEIYFLLDHKLLISVDLEENPVLDQLPGEVVEAGWDAMRDRLKSLRANQEQKVLKEVKLLLLGNTNVGKSNLAEYFETNKEPMLTDSTHGTQYKILQNVVEGVNINCWDFGGQDFFHATHRLFFSPGALHIVLWSKADSPREEGEACFDLHYWLRSIEQLLINFYGKDGEKKTEVIICENKIDKQEFRESRPLIEIEIFKDLTIAFAHINLKPLKKPRAEYLKGLLAEKIEGLFHTYSISYHNYLSVIRNSPGPVVHIDDISKDNIESVQIAVRVFHNMGLLLYFPYIIPDKVFCKPQTLLDLLYEKILGREKNYRLSKDDIKKAIANNELGLTEKNVIDLLKYFDLIFQILPQDDIFFIPQYLPSATGLMKLYIADSFDPADILVESDHYLMSVAMQKIYSYYGTYVVSDASNEYLFWKDGIVIKKGGQKLMIKFDRAGQSISLFPDIHHTNFDLQHELVDFILHIPVKSEKARILGIREGDKFTFHKHEVNWESKFFDVYVSESSEHFVKWTKLVEAVEIGMEKVVAYSSLKKKNENDKGIAVLISEFNKFLPDKFRRIKTKLDTSLLTRKPEIFFSYAWGEEREKIVDELYDSLEADNNYRLWRDKKDVDYGELFSEFMKRMGAADGVIVVISDKYLRSEYCMFELWEIFRNSKLSLSELKKKIFPVYAEDVDLLDPSVENTYINHWKEKETQVKQLTEHGRPSSKRTERLIRIQKINAELGDLLDLLRDMNTLTKGILSANNFAAVKKAIEKRITELSW